jgi:hypothetical protein
MLRGTEGRLLPQAANSKIAQHLFRGKWSGGMQRERSQVVFVLENEGRAVALMHISVKHNSSLDPASRLQYADRAAKSLNTQ